MSYIAEETKILVDSYIKSCVRYVHHNFKVITLYTHVRLVLSPLLSCSQKFGVHDACPLVLHNSSPSNRTLFLKACKTKEKQRNKSTCLTNILTLFFTRNSIFHTQIINHLLCSPPKEVVKLKRKYTRKRNGRNRKLSSHNTFSTCN